MSSENKKLAIKTVLILALAVLVVGGVWFRLHPAFSIRYKPKSQEAFDDALKVGKELQLYYVKTYNGRDRDEAVAFLNKQFGSQDEKKILLAARCFQELGFVDESWVTKLLKSPRQVQRHVGIQMLEHLDPETRADLITKKLIAREPSLAVSLAKTRYLCNPEKQYPFLLDLYRSVKSKTLKTNLNPDGFVQLELDLYDILSKGDRAIAIRFLQGELKASKSFEEYLATVEKLWEVGATDSEFVFAKVFDSIDPKESASSIAHFIGKLHEKAVEHKMVAEFKRVVDHIYQKATAPLKKHLMTFFWENDMLSASPRYWERIPVPGHSNNRVSKLGLDEQEGLWVMAGQGCYWWDEKEHAWKGPILDAGACLDQLYGDPKRGLFATQHGGKVYRLNAGKATEVLDFQYDSSSHDPAFRVSKNGRLINWAKGTLGVFADGKWTRTDFVGTLDKPVLLDRGTEISIYSKGALYVIDEKSRIRKLALDWRQKYSMPAGTVWGKDKAILLDHDKPGLRAFHASTGKDVDVSAANKVLGKRSVYDLFRAPDGAVWVLARDPRYRSYVIFRIATDGQTKLIPATAGVRWNSWGFHLHPKCVVSDGGGALWFANGKSGVFAMMDDKLIQFKPLENGNPWQPRQLAARSDGVIFAAGAELHAYTNGESITGRPRQAVPKISRLGKKVWSHGKRVTNAWYVDGHLLCFQDWKSLDSIDLASGKTRFSMAAKRFDDPWVSAGRKPGELTVCLKDRIMTIDAESGKTVRSLTLKRDKRIAPIPFGDGYVVVPAYRGKLFQRTANGQKLWSTSLPGYVRNHPSVHGHLMITQTRGPGRDGEATSAVDLRTGTVMWSKKTDSCGVVFADDARYLVEAEDRNKARLICRDPKSGQVLWTYAKDGTRLRHKPVLDPVTDRVFAVLANGLVVCVDAVSGKTVWETMLIHQPLGAPGAYYDPYWNSMSYSNGLVLVADRRGILHIQQARTGDVLDRVALGEKALAQPPVLAATPLLIGNLLVVSSDAGVNAYAYDAAALRPKGEAPSISWHGEPAKQSDISSLKLSFKTVSDAKELTVRYRCDDGVWKKETIAQGAHDITLSQLANGKHRCRIQVYDSYGRPSNALVHEFEIGCDYPKRLAELVPQLGAETARDRNEAQKELIDLGPAVLPFLKKYREQSDPEIRLRIKNVFSVLENAAR